MDNGGNAGLRENGVSSSVRSGARRDVQMLRGHGSDAQERGSACLSVLGIQVRPKRRVGTMVRVKRRNSAKAAKT